MAYGFNSDMSRAQIKQAIVTNTDAVTINSGATGTLNFSYSGEFQSIILGVEVIRGMVGLAVSAFNFGQTSGTLTLMNVATNPVHGIPVEAGRITVRLKGI